MSQFSADVADTLEIVLQTDKLAREKSYKIVEEILH
jgi:hypothetical protein